jgi:hypothetical protein
LAYCRQLRQPASGKVHVSFCGLPAAFFERVKHVERFGELGDVQNPMLEDGMESDFLDSCSDRRHGPPIDRFKALLQPSQLDAGQSPCIAGERPYIFAGGTQPHKVFIGHG